MKFLSLLLGLLTLPIFFPGVQKQTNSHEEKSMKIQRITPILAVSDVDVCVKFWVERMGFTKTAEVPDGNKLAFASLEKDGHELMYQSYASMEAEDAALAGLARNGRAFLYIEVDDLDRVIGAMKGAEIAVPLRTTFYGMKEIGVKDPAGHVILFAQRVASQK